MTERLDRIDALHSVVFVVLSNPSTASRADRRPLSAEPTRTARRVRSYIGKGARDAR
ncbi:hypothetical protein FHR84_003255 [Actinopolyspora biskrensis]|uniref:Uncharacterized protein n=1 Tax=Actinopolyspora biskrensis TaxID=1470178 RepID=A0A852Z8N8_9ACTN|nr:hypothetical protein [Actinopolyspora biskrensis]NYH79906.1 hypothetical protein [Actinopolyspora biskrensis]